jgi:phosphoenolpyruvate synthase/pyruvate phosphate dikinase
MLSPVSQIKSVRWRYFANRRESVLFHSNTDRSFAQFYKLTSIPVRVYGSVRFKTGEFFFLEENVEKIQNYFRQHEAKAMERFRRRLIMQMKALDDLSTRLEKVPTGKQDIQTIARTIKKFYAQALQSKEFLMPVPLLGEVLSELILKKLPDVPVEKKQQMLATLTFPLSHNSHIDEEKSFYKLVSAYKSKRLNFEKLLTMHLKNFAWIGARGYFFDLAWDKNDILSRIKNYLATKKNPISSLREIDILRSQMIKEKKQLLLTLKIKPRSELFRLLSLAQEFSYLRTWRTDVMYRSGYRLRYYFWELLKRHQIDVSLLPFFTASEILKLTMHYPVKLSDIKKRKNDFFSLFFKGQYNTFVDKKIIRAARQHLLPVHKKTKKLTGVRAYQGVIVGHAKVVVSSRELHTVRRGDILVATMTFPNYVPAMEKAAGFITDEGGILCHAAIIAREMKKPCVIATKYATKIIKSGDKIKLDADTGMITILEKK